MANRTRDIRTHEKKETKVLFPCLFVCITWLASRYRKNVLDSFFQLSVCVCCNETIPPDKLRLRRYPSATVQQFDDGVKGLLASIRDESCTQHFRFLSYLAICFPFEAALSLSIVNIFFLVRVLGVLAQKVSPHLIRFSSFWPIKEKAESISIKQDRRGNSPFHFEGRTHASICI